MKVSIQDNERYVDGYLYQNLQGLTEYVDKSWDGLIYVGGYEGDAKSTLANQMAAFVDPTYNLERCVFTPQQFEEAVLSAKPRQAIVYDEAQDVFESTNRGKDAMRIKRLLTRIRRRRLYIFVCAPDFWRINKYLFIHRSRAFIHVYANGTERGFFSFFNRERKHRLFLKGKRDENIHAVKPNFRGRFTKWWPFDEELYDKKKELAERPEKDPENEETKYEVVKNNILDADFVTAEQKADLLGVSRRTVFTWAKQCRVQSANTTYNLEGGAE